MEKVRHRQWESLEKRRAYRVGRETDRELEGQTKRMRERWEGRALREGRETEAERV